MMDFAAIWLDLGLIMHDLSIYALNAQIAHKEPNML